MNENEKSSGLPLSAARFAQNPVCEPVQLNFSHKFSSTFSLIALGNLWEKLKQKCPKYRG
jgi:hypothetical protein